MSPRRVTPNMLRMLIAITATFVICSLFFSVLIALSTLTQAQSRDPGIGGTGDQIDEGNGIGGTGDRADAEPGIGGTGIIGVITGYGSIFVNGYEIEIEDARITNDFGGSASREDLAIGQTVEVEASDSRGAKYVSARAINVRHELSGPIEAIDRNRASLTVLGQHIDLAQKSSDSSRSIPDISTVSIGETVTISGFRRADGTIDVTRVERAAPSRPQFIRGTVGAVDSDGFEFAGNRIRAAMDRRPVGLREGSSVIIIDPEFSGGQRQRIVALPEAPFGGRYRRLSIEGYVGQARTRGLFIGRTMLGPASGAHIEVGKRLIVEGRLDRGNRLAPSFATPPRSLERGRFERPQFRHPGSFRREPPNFENNRFRKPWQWERPHRNRGEPHWQRHPRNWYRPRGRWR